VILVPPASCHTQAHKISDEPIIDEDSKKVGEVVGKATSAAVATGAAAQKH
jgi:hypothetical protein